MNKENKLYNGINLSFLALVVLLYSLGVKQFILESICVFWLIFVWFGRKYIVKILLREQTHD